MINGIDGIKLEVIQFQESVIFLTDLGLRQEIVDDFSSVFYSLNGSYITLIKSDINRVSEIHWGTDSEGSMAVQDPLGTKLFFTKSCKKQIDLQATEVNGWNSIKRINRQVPVDRQLDVIEICHLVFYTTDLEKSKSFYLDLGFTVSDELIGRGTFLRCSPNSGHHDIFLIQSDENRLNHIALAVKDIYQVFSGSLLLQSKNWNILTGPGRHNISSSFYCYFESPLGAPVEIMSNEDFLTEQWKSRSIENNPKNISEWVVKLIN